MNFNFTKPGDDTSAPSDAQLFFAESISIKNVTGEIDVQAYNGNQIELTVEGDPENVAKVTAAVNRRGMLEIDGHQNGVSVSGMVISGSGTVTINGNVVSTTQRSGGLLSRILGTQETISITTANDILNPLKLTLRVPAYRPLNLTLDVVATTKIADLYEKLTLNNMGMGKVNIGKVKEAKLNAGGSGNIETASVDGVLEAKADSMGKIVIRDGDITRLDARSNGSGNITVNGVNGPVEAHADSMGKINVDGRMVASLKARSGGSGNITVGRIDGPVEAKADSMGKIVIRDGIATTLTATSDGSGSVDIPAASGNVTLRANSMGNLKLRGGMVNHLDAQSGSSGSITVGATAQTAELHANSMGHVKVTRVVGRVRKSESSMGRVKISKEG